MLHGENERESVSVQRDMKLKIIFDHDPIYCDLELSIQDWQYSWMRLPHVHGCTCGSGVIYGINLM
jgi:hypothetical protein